MCGQEENRAIAKVWLSANMHTIIILIQNSLLKLPVWGLKCWLEWAAVVILFQTIFKTTKLLRISTHLVTWSMIRYICCHIVQDTLQFHNDPVALVQHCCFQQCVLQVSAHTQGLIPSVVMSVPLVLLADDAHPLFGLESLVLAQIFPQQIIMTALTCRTRFGYAVEYFVCRRGNTGSLFRTAFL